MKITEILVLLAAPKPNITLDQVGIPKVGEGALVPAVLSVVYWVAGITAVVVIIVAGILYATSDGNPQRISRAKNAILYSVIGLIVIMAAFVITNFVVARI